MTSDAATHSNEGYAYRRCRAGDGMTNDATHIDEGDTYRAAGRDTE